jgi:uncharacterized protein
MAAGLQGKSPSFLMMQQGRLGDREQGKKASRMNFLRGRWQYWIVEPCKWLFLCMFQPLRFQKDIAASTLKRRLSCMGRLLLPMLLCSYLLALFIRLVIYGIDPSQYSYFYAPGLYLMPPGAFLSFLWDATWASALSCIIGGLLGSFFGLEYGIAFGLAAGIIDGEVINMADDTLIMISFGLISGLMLGLTFTSLGRARLQRFGSATSGIVLGMSMGIALGVVIGLFVGYWAGLPVRTLGLRMQIADILNGSGNEGNAAGMIAAVVVAAVVTKLIGVIAEGSSHEKKRDMLSVATRIALAVATLSAACVGVVTGDDAMRGRSLSAILLGRSLYGLEVSSLFLVSYISGYYKLPLYPVSAISMLRAWLRSRTYPARVFHYLRHCSLHWDEYVFPPLPGLKKTLLLAAAQDVDETLAEIDFLWHERPERRKEAVAVVLEMVLSDLEQRESLRDIGAVEQQLNRFVGSEMRGAHPRIARELHLLEDISRDAAKYYMQIDWQARTEILEGMQRSLHKLLSDRSPSTAALDGRLERIVQQWQRVVKYELHIVGKMRPALSRGRIENPYVPGLVLEQRDPLFVGRRDLARRLNQALSVRHPPTLFLSGERRMGKSSILKQLPYLLGTRYLPIFYDLQSTGITSSIAALLAAIAEEVHDTLLTRGMLIRKLTYEQLKEDMKENEAVVYHHFERWLKEVERVLAQEDLLLLLAFDEFEKLAEAEQKNYLDLSLLFDWFRSTIQRQSRLALLFSGVKSISEMGTHWSGYFVNVEILKVSFLEPAEAYQLVTHPTPDFPGEDIFGKQVTEEILRVTGCHPFLIQALCSILITHLNDSARWQANIDDVPGAIEELFNKWEDSYFKDLWERTDEDQRTCLRTIYALGRGTVDQIQRGCTLDETTITLLLKKLLKRDLLSSEHGEYCVAAPIFERWIARNS